MILTWSPGIFPNMNSTSQLIFFKVEMKLLLVYERSAVVWLFNFGVYFSFKRRGLDEISPFVNQMCFVPLTSPDKV